jgi:hypothetical protein
VNGAPVARLLGPPVLPVAGLLVPVAGPVRVEPVAADLGPGSWRWPVRWVDTAAGQPVVWCGERRRVQDLSVNGSAWVLAARLGCPDLADRIGLNGDLLVAGLGADGRPVDVPAPVVVAARRAGLLDAPVLGAEKLDRGDVWPAGALVGRV